MTSLLQDIRYAIRQMGKRAGFTAVVVLSLALGIGANTAIFSIINAVMLRSLPVEDPQKLVAITTSDNAADVTTNPIWEQIRDNQKVFSGALAYSPARFDLADGGESHFATGLWVSGDFFRVLGVHAMQGRVFTREDDRHGGGLSGPVAVISYGFWKRNFPGETQVIGKTISLNRNKFEIVGVTPSWFNGLDVDRSFDVAIPIGCEPLFRPDNSWLNRRTAWWLRMLGRLSPGETLQQADAGLKAMAPAVFRATLPPDWDERSQKEHLRSSFALKQVSTGFSDVGTRYRTALFTLMAIVGVVLLIACANIANLLLARAVARQREFSVRMAVGAGRWRVIRQLMTESILLSSLGAGAGLLLAMSGSKLLVRLLSTAKNPLHIDVSPDVRVFLFTAGVTLLTTALFGLAPALRATFLDLNRALKEKTGGALRGATRFNLGKALVAGQIALSLVLLVAAGLFMGTLRNLLTLDDGFNRRHLLVVNADLQQAAVPKEQRVGLYREILGRIQTLPNVVSAASSFITPISGLGWNSVTYPEGYVAKSRFDTLLFFNRVSPGYFRTMQTPLLAGRDFNEHDNLSSTKVVIIDEATARRFFNSSSPIGKMLGKDATGKSDEKETYEIVGVVKNAKYSRVDETPTRTAFLAAEQNPDPDSRIGYEIRTDGPVEAVIPSIRATIAEQNRDVALEFHNFEVMVNESLVQPRVVALLSFVFGALALLLAMVGLYGVTAYAVTRRQSEIGIRMALGAQRQAMIWLVVRDVLVLLAVGICVGLAASLAAGRLVGSLLFGVQPNAPAQLAGAAVILAAAAALAAYLPARRAANVDPMVALRYE